MTDKQNLSCSQMSLDKGEHLYGTAPQIKNWFLLEYRGVWRKDAFAESSLPQEVKDHLRAMLSSFEESRIQFIGEPSPNKKDIVFYYAHSSEFSPKLYKFEFANPRDLLEINLMELVQTGEIERYSCDQSLALVCTHGGRDICCAQFGVAVLREIADQPNLCVWRSSHVGAHRFAANVVMLPEGIYYGRVSRSNARQVMESHLKGEIFLDCYRGRSCFSQTSQVADYFLREQTGILGIYDIRWEFEKDRDQLTAVEFGVEGKDTVYSVNTVVINQTIKLYASCGDEKLTEFPQFYFYSLIPYQRPQKPKEQ